MLCGRVWASLPLEYPCLFDRRGLHGNILLIGDDPLLVHFRFCILRVFFTLSFVEWSHAEEDPDMLILWLWPLATGAHRLQYLAVCAGA